MDEVTEAAAIPERPMPPYSVQECGEDRDIKQQEDTAGVREMSEDFLEEPTAEQEQEKSLRNIFEEAHPNEDEAVSHIDNHWGELSSTDKTSYLFMAIQKFCFKAAYHMIKCGVNVNQRKHGGSCSTPLHMAAVVGNYKMIQKLLDEGAEPDAKDAQNKTPLHWAVESKHSSEARMRRCVLELLQALHSKTKKNVEAWKATICQKGNDGRTALDAALSKKRLHVAALLLAVGCTVKDTNLLNNWDQSKIFKNESVQHVLKKGDLEVVSDDKHLKKMLSFKSIEEYLGHSLLVTIAEGYGENASKKIRRLLYSWMDINRCYDAKKGNAGMTPLMTAAKYSNIEAMKLLLAYKADCMLRGTDKKLAIHFAAEHCNPNIWQHLIKDKGPEQAKSRDAKNKMPSTIAKERGHDDAAEELKKKAEWTRQQELDNYDKSKLPNITIKTNELEDIKPLPQEFVYNMKQDRTGSRGLAVIINIQKDGEHPELKGYEMDMYTMVALWQALGFTPEVYQNLRLHTLDDVLRDISEDERLSDHSCLVVVLMGHGNKDQQISVMHDGKNCPKELKYKSIADIMTAFDGAHCPCLNGKPKVFLVQACRGVIVDEGVMQSAAVPSDEQDNEPDMKVHQISTFADLLSLHATTEGTKSFVHQSKGSVFLQVLAEVFAEYACIMSFSQMAAIVIRKVSSQETIYDKEKLLKVRQCPELKTTSTKELYFFPEANNLQQVEDD